MKRFHLESKSYTDDELDRIGKLLVHERIQLSFHTVAQNLEPGKLLACRGLLSDSMPKLF